MHCLQLLGGLGLPYHCECPEYDCHWQIHTAERYQLGTRQLEGISSAGPAEPIQEQVRRTIDCIS